MAIAEMQKLNLVALSYDRDGILNALQRTGAVEVTFPSEVENTTVPIVNLEEGQAKLSSVEAALQALSAEVEKYDKENKTSSGVLKDGFVVTYEDFISAKDRGEAIEESIAKINALIDERNGYKNELAKLKKELKSSAVYSSLTLPFSAFLGTANTRGRLGTVSATAMDSVLESLSKIELCEAQALANADDTTLMFVLSHKSVSEATDGILSTFGFSDCPYQGEETGKDRFERLQAEERSLLAKISENECAVYVMKEEIKPIKIYADALAFELEKETLSEKLRTTASTFLLEGYVPAFMTEKVKEELLKVSSAVYIAFSEPTEEETPPTLLQNGKLVESFEGITNMYSPPHYREFDPNGVMAFFYSLFMGFIIGDMGYGILMSLIGGFIWWKNRNEPTGMSRLAGAFACGGVFAVLFGALFNSFFGIAIFGAENTIMPDPQKGMCALVGIEVPSVLVIALVIGIVHLLVGYVCKAVQEFRRGNLLDGIFDGITWAVFSLGAALAIVGLVEFRKYPNINLSFLAPIGGITAGVALAIAVFSAARKGKGFGRFTKSFGAAYGIINYASDILSYARLYGLMLSGAVVAQIISSAALGFFAGGNILLILLGVVLLVVGHAFNLVMNLLGAYIHDARLQYVEFYGRFFEGEGELFKPLGSSQKYIRLKTE